MALPSLPAYDADTSVFYRFNTDYSGTFFSNSRFWLTLKPNWQSYINLSATLANLAGSFAWTPNRANDVLQVKNFYSGSSTPANMTYSYTENSNGVVGCENIPAFLNTSTETPWALFFSTPSIGNTFIPISSTSLTTGSVPPTSINCLCWRGVSELYA